MYASMGNKVMQAKHIEHSYIYIEHTGRGMGKNLLWKNGRVITTVHCIDESCYSIDGDSYGRFLHCIVNYMVPKYLANAAVL